MPYRFQIGVECFQVTVPIFTYGIKIISPFTSHRIKKLCDKLVFHMLDSIQPESVESKFTGNPFPPTVQFGYNLRMVQINIITQQKVIIAILIVHSLAPGFSFSLDLKDSATFLGVVKSRTGEVIPVPLKIRILVLTSMEAISGPALYLIRFAQRLVPFFGVNLHDHKLFGKITACLMVQHYIQINRNMIFVQFANHLFQFILRTVLCPYCPFLFKFAQVIQIISCISFILLLVGFISRWNPDCGYTNVMKMRRVFF